MDTCEVREGDKREMEVGTGVVEKGIFGRKRLRTNEVRGRCWKKGMKWEFVLLGQGRVIKIKSKKASLTQSVGRSEQ